MDRRTMLKAGLAAAGAAAVGLPEAEARAAVPFREITATYDPATRPYTLAKVMLDVDPGDLEVRTEGTDRWMVKRIVDGRKEFGFVPHEYPSSKLISKFQASVEHFMSIHPGAEVVAWDPRRAVEFDFFDENNEIWVKLDPVVLVRCSPFCLINKQWGIIHSAIEQRLLMAQNRRRAAAQAPWGPLWMERQRQALRAVLVTFYVHELPRPAGPPV